MTALFGLLSANAVAVSIDASDDRVVWSGRTLAANGVRRVAFILTGAPPPRVIVRPRSYSAIGLLGSAV